MSTNSGHPEQSIKELTLLLLYLTSWREADSTGEGYRSWKGYPFGILDELTEEGFIYGTHRAKSVWFTDQGVKKAEQLISKYLRRAD